MQRQEAAEAKTVRIICMQLHQVLPHAYLVLEATTCCQF